MNKYLRCTHCGYDMYGPEYLSNVIDSNLYNEGAFYPPEAILSLSTKSERDITCPFCHTTGNWTK